MGQQLYETQPVFRQALDRCAEILTAYLDKPLLEIFESPEIDRTIYTQPAIFSLEYALAQLWLSWGVKPDYVAGHSIGEYVAACVAKVFSLEDGLKLVAIRGKLMEELPSSGGMLAIFSSQEKVAELIAAYRQEVNIAAINNSQNVVIAGKSNTLTIIEDKLARLDIASTLLEVSHAFHSPLMKPMLADFQQVAQTITYSQPEIPLVSNVTAQLAAEDITDPTYWVEHIVQPVRFADSFQFLLKEGVDIFLEIGAKPILSSIGKSIATDYTPVIFSSLSHKQEDWQVILNSVAQLYHQGIDLDWQAFSRVNTSGIKLPTYPFQRQRYWWDKAKFWTQNNSHQQLHPLLGDRLTLAETSEIRFTSQINANNPQYLQDHCLKTKAVFPATAYLEMALAAGRSIYPDSSLQLREFSIKQPLILEDVTQLQTVLSSETNSTRIQIFSRTSDREFILHGEVWLDDTQLQSSVDIGRLKSQLQPYPLEIADYYQTLSDRGLNYGVSFRGIKQIWQGEGEALGYIQLPDIIETADNYQLHPALLDACLQLIGTVTDSQSGVYLPVGIESLVLAKPGSNSLWSHVTLKPTTNDLQIQADLSLYDNNGAAVAKITNLSLQYLSLESLRKLVDLPSAKPDNIADWLYEIEWEQKDLENTNNIDRHNDTWIVFAEEERTQQLADSLSGTLVSLTSEIVQSESNREQINYNCVEDFQQLWNNFNCNLASNLKIVYFATNRDAITDCKVIFYLMQSLAKANLKPTQLTIVTEQTQYKSVKNLSGVWGLGRTIMQEYPNLNCSLIDLDCLNHTDSTRQLLRELQSCDGETQIAYHDGKRYVARLTPKDNTLNNPFRLQLSDYGTLDNLTLAPQERKSPSAGEIEIEVAASGVNFRDVLNALGVLKEYLQAMGFADSTEVPFGGECAGLVVAVGAGVTNFKVGDEVIAAQAVGSLSSHVTVNAKFAIAKPEHLNYAEAATIPTTFLTAYYGLHYLAKIQPGDKILIHAAAGGVGQAAVQLAQQAGAEVYATASVGKWDFLKASGVKYVMNSRTLDFAEEVMQLTEGEGVDLILNSLNGDFIAKNLEILAPGGRFIEIGKVGIWSREQVREKRKDISYFPFDLLEVSNSNPDLIATLFAELRQQFINRELQPLAHKVFPIQQADDAFRYMAQAKHIGKVVISLPKSDRIVKPDGSYLITGGLGALGLQVANWLAEEGARSLILLGRSQPSESARREINKLEQQGVAVQVIQADITDYEALEKALTNLSPSPPIPQSPNPPAPHPIRGIIHAAGILDDGLLKTLTWERFQKVLQPKITGAWNLHLISEKLSLDWFVCFSSVVSVFGAAGQSNYGAANAFMDNLISYRRSLGLPGTSINWSIWDEVGMASRLTSGQQQNLTQQGLKAIAPKQGLKVLKQLIQQQTTQTIVFPVDWKTFLDRQPHNLFFAKLKPQTTAKPASTSFLQQLAQTPKSDRYEILQSYIREQIAKVLGFSDPEDIDTQEKFADLGMDSLMAVEFKNSLQASLGRCCIFNGSFRLSYRGTINRIHCW